MNQLTYPDIARISGTGLISTGVGLLLFVVITIVWGDPFTRLTASSEQATLARQFAQAEPAASDLADASLDPELTRRSAAIAEKSTALGTVAGRVAIPKLGLRSVFVHGARTPDLTKGPGLYREVKFPGSGQPVAIAGHRTTYGAPFLNVDKLAPGDPIVITMAYGRFTYTVTRTQIVTPTDWSIINFGAAEPTQAARRQVLRSRQCVDTCEHLVLTACHPKHSAARRIAVFARLSRVELAAGTGGRSA